MSEKYLYETLESLQEAGKLEEIPEIIKNGLSSRIALREYQELAFKYFITYFENENLKKNKQVHTLFHMATGSGKTVIMAGLILYLYTKGYNKFLFFVDKTNIVEKTKENFINSNSSKYLFNSNISYLGNDINIKMVENFTTDCLQDDIEICFTTTQKLRMNLLEPKENSLTYKDFEDNKIVFISDESHHINTMTKKSKKLEDETISWEYSVVNALARNKDSILLEFTATANLNDKNVEQKYKDKIIFDYTLKKFRESGYTKDFKNFATMSELWDRTLMAIIISEYRKFLFSELKLNIKPVVMLKFKEIKKSKDFFDLFFENMDNLTADYINKFYSTNLNEDEKDSTKYFMNKVLKYFKSKDESLNLLLDSLKNSFTKETSIIMNGSTDNKTNQLLINSLEDKDNPIRTVFAVDMLNEGWDVLNLFDIVRLYDKGSKDYTTKEAQLIGRGARYCPFKLNNEQDMYKRKYDLDLDNDYRILETMLFHSRDDSKYINELRQILIKNGLEEEKRIELNYVLKEEFKNSNFYRDTYVYSNFRIPQNRENVTSVEENFKNKIFSYNVNDNQGKIYDTLSEDINFSHKQKTISFKLRQIDYNVLVGASEKYPALKFNVVKNKYPNVKSMREFLTSDDYLGNIRIQIKYYDKLNTIDIFNACLCTFDKISNYIINIKQEFKGSKKFEPRNLKDVIKDKKIYISSIDSNIGKGVSQNTCIDENYALDLSKEDWYVFNDNYGTSEEKAFIKYFKTDIVPILEEKNLEFYVIRNERISELAIYNFSNGERFEPDYLIFIKKRDNTDFTINQVYAEPKGNHLLENDSWKEEFLLEINNQNKIIKGNDGYNYKVLGLPFFNKDFRISDFEKNLLNIIENM